jgi:hypothetical protein
MVRTHRTSLFSRAACIAILGFIIAAIGTASANTEQYSTVEPNNSLERHLLAVQSGERKLPEFFEKLVDSEVVVLSKRDVLDQKTPEDISALVIPGSNNEQRMLAVFTSPELAHRVAKTYPEYRFGITTEFIWLLAHTAPGLGIAINPGWNLGMVLPSYGVLQMRDRYSDRIDQQLD